MTDAIHGQPRLDGDDDVDGSHRIRVMRSMAHHDTDAETAAAQEADVAREERRRQDDVLEGERVGRRGSPEVELHR